MYFSNSQASRDLPIPAIPMIETSCARCSSTEAWNSSFTSLSSRSRPTNGASRPVERIEPRARRRPRGALATAAPARPFPSARATPASSYAIDASAARFVDSPTSTVPGSAADWMREAVLTRSPATMPWPSAPSVTAASPVSTPGARRAARVELRHRGDQVQRSAHRPLGVVLLRVGAPHTAITASPMNFSTVPP